MVRGGNAGGNLDKSKDSPVDDPDSPVSGGASAETVSFNHFLKGRSPRPPAL